jgi:hypothetical protein
MSEKSRSQHLSRVCRRWSSGACVPGRTTRTRGSRSRRDCGTKALRPGFCLAVAVSAIAGCASGIPPVEESRWFWPQNPTLIVERPAKLDWGPENAGLQLAAWADQEDRAIYCVIRNATDRPISLHPEMIGYWQLLSVEVLVPASSEWSTVPLKEQTLKAYLNYVEDVTCTIPPGKEFLRRFLKLEPMIGTGFRATKRKPPFSYTFAVNLNEYEFPAGFQDPIGVRVSHKFDTFSENAWSGTLISNPCTIELGIKPDRHKKGNDDLCPGIPREGNAPDTRITD